MSQWCQMMGFGESVSSLGVDMKDRAQQIETMREMHGMNVIIYNLFSRESTSVHPPVLLNMNSTIPKQVGFSSGIDLKSRNYVYRYPKTDDSLLLQ